MPKRWIIIDFDSTFLKSELLAEFAKKALHHNKKRDELVAQVAEITKQGMEGTISFSTSLRSRLKLFAATKTHLEELVAESKHNVSDSVIRNREFFKTHATSIYIISGGFQEVIVPIVREFGISEDHVRANSLRYDSKGTIIGVDETNPLSHDRGKLNVVRSLKLKGEVIVIGDGMTDYEIKASGAAHKFFAFTENVSRPAVNRKADQVVRNFDEFLYHLKLK